MPSITTIERINPVEFESQRFNLAHAAAPFYAPADTWPYHGMPHGWQVSDESLRTNYLWRRDYDIRLPIKPLAFAGIIHDIGAHLNFKNDPDFANAEQYAAAVGGSLMEDLDHDPELIMDTMRLVASGQFGVELQEDDEIAQNRNDLFGLPYAEKTLANFWKLYSEECVRNPGTSVEAFVRKQHPYVMGHVDKDRPVHELDTAVNGKSHWRNKSFGGLMVVHVLHPEFAEICGTKPIDELEDLARLGDLPDLGSFASLDQLSSLVP